MKPSKLKQIDITNVVRTAQRGLRRDVQALCDVLDQGILFVPLASAFPLEDEEVVVLEEDTMVNTHMLSTPEGQLYCPLFTRVEMMSEFESSLGWDTDEGPLRYCGLPLRHALNMDLELLQEDDVMGVVINAGDDSELVLSGHELDSIIKGQAIPLQMYIYDLPIQEDEENLIGLPATPPPQDLVDAIDQVLSRYPKVAHYDFVQTFNADRDTEPHLTLNIHVDGSQEDFEKIANDIIEASRGKIPPPGYIDVMFNNDALVVN